MQQFVEYIQQFGRFQRNAQLYLLTNALTGVSGGIILVLYTLYLAALGYDTNLIGLVLFVATIGIGITIFPAGLCIDRFSSKAILIWSTVLISVTGAGQMLFHNPVLLCISVFFVGVGAAFQFVLYAPFLTTNSTPIERVHLFSSNTVIILVTLVLGEVFGGALPLWLHEHPWAMLPGLSWPLATQPLARSYQISLLLAGLLAAPGFIPLFLMTDDRPTHTRAEPQGSRGFRNFCASIAGTVPRAGNNPYDGAKQAWSKSASWSRLRTFLLSPLAALVGANMLLGFGAGMLLPYFSLFFVQHLGATSALFGIIDGTANILNALGTLFAPWLALRVGRVATILLPRLLTIPILLGMGVCPFLLLAAILYLLRQGLTGIPNSMLEVVSMEVVSAEQRGLANSSYQSANKMAWAAATPIGGIIISRLGYTPVFFIAAAFYSLAVALIWWRFGGKRSSGCQKY